MQHENIYALVHGPEDAPTFFYIGKTSRTLEQRFAEHMKGFNDPFNVKPAYEAWRHLPEDTDVRIILLDTTASGLTEQDYVRAAILDGHPLTNANLGNAKVAKKRTKNEFSVLNKQADERLDAIERRKRLHSDAQQLQKHEIVRQRVLGTITDAETLDGLAWRTAPVELMPMGKLPKNTDDIHCESLKYGDYLIIVAFKKGKWAYWVKNTTTNQADAYKVNWRMAPRGFTRLDALKRITQDWPTFMWWPLGKT